MRHLPLIRLSVLVAALSLTAGCGDDQNSESADAGITVDSGSSSDTDSPDSGPGDVDQDSGLADTGDPDGGGGSEGRVGLEGFCDYFFECGGNYYADADDCIAQSVDYWGECRRPELDAFGDCMMGLTCEEWGNPDTYNPASTDCAEEWSDVQQASCE